MSKFDLWIQSLASSDGVSHAEGEAGGSSLGPQQAPLVSEESTLANGTDTDAAEAERGGSGRPSVSSTDAPSSILMTRAEKVNKDLRSPPVGTQGELSSDALD